MRQGTTGWRRFAQRMWDDSERAYRARLLELVPPAAGPLLDVGCDDGSWTEQVRRRAGVAPTAVSGIELIAERGERAAARGFAIESCDIEGPWPFDDASFSLVHANQVIEHVKRLDHFVSEARRVLRPGGTLLVCTENLASWHNVAALLMGWMPFTLTNVSSTGAIGNPLALHPEAGGGYGESWQHVHVITPRALSELLQRHDFQVDDSLAIGYHPLRGRLARWAARRNPAHAHFIGARAQVSAGGAGAG
jgi:SAM-dependent methyltransferase